MPFTAHGAEPTRISTRTRRRLRGQWAFVSLLVGGSLTAIIIEIVTRTWTAFHAIALQNGATPAVVAVGISLKNIFVVIALTGVLLSIATAIEVLWRRLRLAR